MKIQRQTKHGLPCPQEARGIAGDGQPSQRTMSLEWEKAGSCRGAESTGAHEKPTLGGIPDQVTFKLKSRVRISQAIGSGQGRKSTFQTKGALCTEAWR